MTDSKGFDLAALLGEVSKMDISGEQIVRLPLELLDPDPENFYSLDGLDELAANIETVGLLDPIRVRPSGERYMIVSGHRRRAAIQMIRDGGSEQFAAGVACIVEYGEASDAMRKLRLIYANSATRQLTSAELSRQAEEVTRLLYELKEQGVEFPGRMREHVAQACNTTKSKLARLHAIRNNAQEYVLDAYDEGKINESVAYELQKLDKGAQKLYMVQRRRDMLRLDLITAEEVAEFGRLASRLRTLDCKQTRGLCCPYSNARLETALHRMNHSRRGNCTQGRCCADCHEMMDCEELCPKCEHKREEQKEAAARRMMAAAEDRKAREAQRRAESEENARKNAEIWARIRKAAEASGVDLRAALRAVYAEIFDSSDVDEIVAEALSYAVDLRADEYGEAENLLAESAPKLATALGCTLDWLYGLADTPRATPQSAEPTAPLAQGSPEAQTDAPAPWPTVWQTGTPNKEGWYAVRGVWTNDPGIPIQEFFYWCGTWYESENDANRSRQQTYATVQRWFPLPEEVTK